MEKKGGRMQKSRIGKLDPLNDAESLWIGRLSRQSNVDFALHLPIIELLTGQVDDPESDDGSGFFFFY
jgi:hypothetical protein